MKDGTGPTEGWGKPAKHAVGWDMGKEREREKKRLKTSMGRKTNRAMNTMVKQPQTCNSPSQPQVGMHLSGGVYKQTPSA